MNTTTTSELKFSTHHQLKISGSTHAGPIHLNAHGFVHGTIRVVIAEIEIAGRQNLYHIFSDSSARMIHLHAHGEGHSLRMLLTGLANPQVNHATIWHNDAAAPEHFLIDVATLIKTKNLKASIRAEKGNTVYEILGEQPYDAVENEFGRMLQTSKAYDEFMRLTQSDASQFPPTMPGWCIAIYTVPVLGAAGLLIPRCR